MLDKILNARSVAIIGASKNPTKRGYQAIKTLLEDGYEGKIFPRSTPGRIPSLASPAMTVSHPLTRRWIWP
jgi:acyl-CoA synthetase (NDP forming)